MTTLTKKKAKSKSFDPVDGLGEIALILDARRQELGITVSSLETSGVLGQGAWGRAMRGQRTPSLATLSAMAAAVGLKLSLTLEEE